MNFNQFELGDISQEDCFLMIFWRSGCPTCRLTLPIFQRIQDAYPLLNVTGIAQETEIETVKACKELGVAFSQISDTDLILTRKSGIKHVPSYFLYLGENIPELTGTGFSQESINRISKRVAGHLKLPEKPIFHAGDVLPVMQPG